MEMGSSRYRVTKLSLLVLSIALIASCASTPRKTAYAWLDAMWADDYDRAKEYSTPNHIHSQLKYLQWAYELLPPEEWESYDLNRWDWAYIRSHLEIKVDGDTARVWEMGFPEDYLILVKVDGVWLVDELVIEDWGFDFEELKHELEREALHGF